MEKKKAISIIEQASIAKSSFVDLSGLGLTAIPQELSEIEQLQILNLSNNLISDTKPLSSFKNIKIVDLRNNKISVLDKNLLKLGLTVKWKFDYAEEGLYLEENPIDNVPFEIISQGNSVIESYIDAVENSSGGKYLNEAKIALVGDGAVGKTTITLALLKHPFDSHKIQTKGIEISSLFLEINNQPIKLKFWDFGTQEIMHSTHQLFLTKRTVYLLVADSRQESNIEYWLKTVQTFAGEVPIIIVINKIDLNPGFELNRRQLKRKYPNIISFQRVSCLTHEGIADLLNQIKLCLQDLEHLKTIIPSSWFQIKERLESTREDFIDYSEYTTICEDFGVFDPSQQNVLSDFLHDLGTIIHFKNLPLFSTQILNPIWITEAIYRIINSPEAFTDKGEIDTERILKILSPFKKTYPEDKGRFIIEIMKEFELLFEVQEDHYIIPDLLPIQEPETDFDHDNALSFIFEYDFLPSNLFPRILVRLQEFITEGIIWRYGVLISRGNSKSIITIDKIDRKIEIQCSGVGRRDLLYVVRDTIKKLNNSYLNMIVREFVLEGENNVQINYQEIKSLLEADEKTIFVSSIHKRIDIEKLINQIEPESKKELDPIKIFISYSHKDSGYKTELLSHLSPLIRLNEVAVWEDGQLIPGQQWKTEILLKLNESDIILCLISSDFISSEFCYSIELKEALAAHSKKEKVVIPVLIRKCFWEKLPIAEIQGVPFTPISSQDNVDEGWLDVVVGVDKSLNLIRKLKYGIQHKL